MEQIKHECGIALIRLLKPLNYYKEKYGSASYGLNKLYLLMEKQHNRGQEAAGVGVVKLRALPGSEYLYRERALGPSAIGDIFSKMRHAIVDNIEELEEILAAPELQRLYPGWCGNALKTIPKGWPKDHPQAPLLRLLDYGKEHELDIRFFDDPAWPERCSELMRPLKPLVDFINYSLYEE